jgi:hypothetical protein
VEQAIKGGAVPYIPAISADGEHDDAAQKAG